VAQVGPGVAPADQTVAPRIEGAAHRGQSVRCGY
jgi:hypothetical protein